MSRPVSDVNGFFDSVPSGRARTFLSKNGSIFLLFSPKFLLIYVIYAYVNNAVFEVAIPAWFKKYYSGLSRSSIIIGKNMLWSQAVQNLAPLSGSLASQFGSTRGLQALQAVHGS